jgi:superkiller protein 3
MEPFEDRVDILFHELELATKWQRPSVLLAIYSSDTIRDDADIALENRLHNLGQSAYHIKIKNQKNADVSLLISELANLSNVIFFVEGLHWGAGEEDRCTYRTLNKSREFFIENQIRVVFWLTEDEAIDLAHFAPDYWSFRHRVIEFFDSPKSGPVSPHVLESAWQGEGESDGAAEDLDAKIALRVALLTDLPKNNESTSSRANLLLTLGMLHWRRGDNEKASQFLNTALDLAAGMEDARFEALCFNAIALVETGLGRIEAAIQAYQNAIGLAPEHISAWNALGNLYRKLERNDDALAAFQKAVEQNSSDAVGWFGLGDLQLALGRASDAIYAFLKSIEFSPNYAPAWSGLGNCYMAEKQLEQALEAHLKAIEIDRLCLDSRLALGDIYRQQGKDEEASLAYRTVQELDPGNLQTQKKLGALHSTSGTREATPRTCQPAVTSDQDSSTSYGDQAEAYVQKGRYTEAIPLLQKAIQLSDGDAQAARQWNCLGDAYRQLGDYEQAMQAYRNADTLHPQKAATLPQAVEQFIPTEDLSVPPVIDIKPGDVQEKGRQDHDLEPHPSESAVSAAPDSLPEFEEKTAFPGEPRTEGISWLDGLAAFMTDFHQQRARAATPAASASLDRLDQMDMDLEMQFIQPPADYPVFTKDEPAQPAQSAKEETFSWEEPWKMFLDDQAALQATMPADPEPEAPTPAQPSSPTSSAVEEENAHLWNELGSIYFNTGAYAEAINAFKRAIQLDRSYPWSYNNLAALYSRQGHYQDAVPMYQKGLQYVGDPCDKALLWNRLGDTYRRLNDHDRAAGAYRKAMELDPANVSLLTRARFSLLGNCRA